MSFWKNLWRNAFEEPTFETMGRYSDIKERERASNHDDPLPPPPEPSCFAKGLALSIQIEPEVWERMSVHYSLGTERLNVKHRKTQAQLKWFAAYEGHTYEPRVTVDDRYLSDEDAAYLISTIKAHPLGQYKMKCDKEKLKEDREKAARAHFESLGCPPSP
jgi:hypothetical protein